MIVYDDVPIADLVKKFFRETYGVEEDELYYNVELCERIRNAVKELRYSYKNNVCVTDYSVDENRKAYMIAYYPYYIMPACYVAENFVAPYMSQHETVCLDFFAGGPCPELLGMVLALKNFYKKFIVGIHDTELGWHPYQKLTFNFAEKLLKSSVATLFSSNKNETDIFFLQNFLSHLPCQSADTFLKKFSGKVKVTKYGTFFVFIDLNYGSVVKVFGKLVDEKFLQANCLRKVAAHIPDNGEPLIIRHGDTTKSLRKNIFVGDDGLKQKKNTKFYFVVLQKI